MMAETQKLDQLAEWLGVTWSDHQLARLLRYEQWLGDEAIVAGGMGPREVDRLFDRHLADALVFLRLIDDEASSLIDVGSGVGLPGIPIAIARPDLAVTLLDRSARRTHLARRALRILGLENTTVLTGEVTSVSATFDVVTFRASLPIATAVEAFGRLACPSGVGIFAWSRQRDPKSPPERTEDTIFRLTSEGAEVLDSPAWLLRMQRSE